MTVGRPPHLLVTQLRFARSELVRGLEGVSEADGLRRLMPMNSIGWREAGVRPSMGSVGDANDNALCESFFASLECELLHRRRFATQVEARPKSRSPFHGTRGNSMKLKHGG